MLAVHVMVFGSLSVIDFNQGMSLHEYRKYFLPFSLSHFIYTTFAGIHKWHICRFVPFKSVPNKICAGLWGNIKSTCSLFAWKLAFPFRLHHSLIGCLNCINSDTITIKIISRFMLILMFRQYCRHRTWQSIVDIMKRTQFRSKVDIGDDDGLTKSDDCWIQTASRAQIKRKQITKKKKWNTIQPQSYQDEHRQIKTKAHKPPESWFRN